MKTIRAFRSRKWSLVVVFLFAVISCILFPALNAFAEGDGDDSEVSNKGNTVRLESRTYYASDILGGFDYYADASDLKYTLTIIMNQDLTIRSLELRDGVALVLKGDHTLTVTEGVDAYSTVGGSPSISIEEKASLNSTGGGYGIVIHNGSLNIDTTGTVTATGTGYYRANDFGGKDFQPGCGIYAQYVSIYNGNVITSGVDGDNILYASGPLIKNPGYGICTYGSDNGVFLYGGSLKASGASYGVSASTFYAEYTGHGSGVYADLSGTEAALMSGAGGSKRIELVSPVTISTPEGGKAGLFKIIDKNYTNETTESGYEEYENYYILDGGGGIAKHAVLTTLVTYTVEVSIPNTIVKVGETMQITPTTKRSDSQPVTNAVYEYTSLTPGVVEVDANGLVKGISPADASVLVTDTANGVYTTVSFSVKADDAGSGEKKSSYSNEWRDGKWYDQYGRQNYSGTLSWKKNSKGWWVEDTLGWYPVSMWQKINGIWYYFDSSGYMVSNQWIDGWWCDSDGSCTYGGQGSWHYDQRGWWYQDTLGWFPQAKWQKIDGVWYYFHADGYLATNQYVDGYWVDGSGAYREY